MATLQVRNLDEHVVAALRERARRHHRSIEGELRHILEVIAAAEAAVVPAPRDLDLRTVSTGTKAPFSREALYDDEDDV